MTRDDGKDIEETFTTNRAVDGNCKYSGVVSESRSVVREGNVFIGQKKVPEYGISISRAV